MLLTRQGISLVHVIDFVEVLPSLEIKAILLTLHVAMQIGLYLHRIEFGVWHVVSEDSDHFRARLTVIHCLHDLNDCSNPLGVRCAFVRMICMHATNFSKSRRFAVRSEYRWKNGMIVSIRSLRFATTN